MGYISCQGEQAKKTVQWIGWADNDYIAARQLLLADALVQGSSLSDTTIEKYFKAIFAMMDLKNPKSHNICKLYEDIKKNGLKLKISEEYLALLFKSYRLRYPDDLEIGFNISLNRTKLLSELDHTVYEIRKGFNFKEGDKEIKRDSRIDMLQKENNPILMSKNCCFGDYDRAALFKELSSCYELRVLGQYEVLEAYYLAEGIGDDGKFEEEGLKPKARKVEPESVESANK